MKMNIYSLPEDAFSATSINSFKNRLVKFLTKIWENNEIYIYLFYRYIYFVNLVVLVLYY